MDFWNALWLGFIQGLTEFLPISSSAHVQIAQSLMPLGNLTKPELTAFIATIQLGTELAVLIYFWADIRRIAVAWLRSLVRRTVAGNPDAKLGWLIIIGSLPVVVVGLLFKDIIETQLRNLWVIAVALIVFGLLLAAADRLGPKQRAIRDLTVGHGIWFGLGQALAVIPGVSRSGGTISVGLALGYTRVAAARYSFLLAIPAVLASGLYEFSKSYQDLPSSALIATGAATAVAFAVGMAVIALLLRYLNRGSFMPFVIWRVALGIALLVALSNGQIAA